MLFLERVRGRVRVRIWINFECTCKFSVLLSKSVRMQRRLSLRIQKQLFHVVVIDRILFLTLFVCEREREKEVIGNTPNLKFRSFAPFQIPIGNIIIILVRERRDRERKYAKHAKVDHQSVPVVKMRRSFVLKRLCLCCCCCVSYTNYEEFFAPFFLTEKKSRRKRSGRKVKTRSALTR